MQISRCLLPALLGLTQLAALGLTQNAHAGSATWNANPGSGGWNTATNWTPNTVPNGPSDVATFQASSNTLISLSADAEVSAIIFAPGANSYAISSTPTNVLSITGAGVSNNSGMPQEILVKEDESGSEDGLHFKNSATAGDGMTYTAMPGTLDPFGSGGNIIFEGSSSAANATFNVYGQLFGANSKGGLLFSGTSTAASATITTIAPVGGFPGGLTFTNDSTAGNAIIHNGHGQAVTIGGFLYFWHNASADHSQITNEGYMVFRDSATTGEATVSNIPSNNGFFEGSINYWNSATAGNGTIDSNGGSGVGQSGTFVHFISSTTADAATLIARGGTNGGGGAGITFGGTSTGGTARLEVFGNGSLDISGRDLPGITIGSLEGDGLAFLGARNLTAGSSNLSTSFSGVIQDGGIAGGTGGSFSKIGSGTLTLSGANTYTGATTASGGVLVAANTSGSATGTGAVAVNGGTLGGNGILAGEVTVNSGGILAPANGGKVQTTLTLQSQLNFHAGASYIYTFKAKARKARTDKVLANGVTINSGATINLSGRVQGALMPGLLLTVISNTSATPISGTFGNLADGAIVNLKGNNFQANYEGGDGNDLTLTVVP